MEPTQKPKDSRKKTHLSPARKTGKWLRRNVFVYNCPDQVNAAALGLLMAAPIRGSRKRRTRQHVIADLSIHHVERYILEAGHTAQRLGSDYGYDLLMTTFDENGYVEPGSIYFQLKASERWVETKGFYPFDLDIRDCNLWIREKMPVILPLFDASRRRAYWLWVQRFFSDDSAPRPKSGSKTIRVQIPIRQTVNARSIARMREIKWAIMRQELGEER